jgi:hypothetical protein
MRPLTLVVAQQILDRLKWKSDAKALYELLDVAVTSYEVHADSEKKSDLKSLYKKRRRLTDFREDLTPGQSDALAPMAEALESDIARIEARTKRERTAFGGLAGHYLPVAYEQFTNRPVKYTVDAASGEVVNSDYATFAFCVLDELGIYQRNGDPYSYRSIIQAVEDVRANRVRRKT